MNWQWWIQNGDAVVAALVGGLIAVLAQVIASVWQSKNARRTSAIEFQQRQYDRDVANAEALISLIEAQVHDTSVMGSRARLGKYEGVSDLLMATLARSSRISSLAALTQNTGEADAFLQTMIRTQEMIARWPRVKDNEQVVVSAELVRNLDNSLGEMADTGHNLRKHMVSVMARWRTEMATFIASA
jgi:hypothetical protein